jgi:FkbM family methyltransferase
LKPFVRVSAHVPSPCWTRLRAGPEILVPLDWVGRALFYFGDLDPKLSWLCRRLLRQGDTMLDIGANIGVMSLIARGLVGPAGSVHAIEPQPHLVELLRESANRNGFENLHVHQCALGAQDQTLELAVPDYNGGAASLIRSLSEYKRVARIPVAVKHTSTFLDSLNLGRIRLMKIDVEGFEPQVIAGGLRYFETHRPDSIVFELNDHSMAFFEQPVVRLLQTMDYEFLNIPKARLRMRLEPLVRQDQPYGHDILAIAKGPTRADALRCLGTAVDASD